VAEMERRALEGRRIYLDLLESTMERKNLNRFKKEQSKLKVKQVIGDISSLTAVTHRCVFTRNIHCHAVSV